MIEEVVGWQALDSRGQPTVAVAVRLNTGHEGRAIAPSGASVGSLEAHERRDATDAYGGRGVQGALTAVRAAAEDLVGLVADPEQIDATLEKLDGTDDLTRLGANACIAISIATLRAASAAQGDELFRYQTDMALRLPLPMVNVFSGGRHAGGLLDFQDFLVIPVGARNFAEAIDMAWQVRSGAAVEATRRGHDTTLVADEGGFGVAFGSNREAVEVLVAAIESVGLKPGSDVAIAIDVAANQLWDGDRYLLRVEGREMDAEALVDQLADWITDYPALLSIEDPLHDQDIDGWLLAMDHLGNRVQLIGDDLFSTRTDRVIKGGGVWANAILVKPNQAGLVTRARVAFETAKERGMATVVSARSGDTEEDWLADLAVGWGADQIKVGSLSRSERTAKWNRLLEIESRNPGASFVGREGLRTVSDQGNPE